jgi:hypothetical protein
MGVTTMCKYWVHFLDTTLVLIPKTYFLNYVNKFYFNEVFRAVELHYDTDKESKNISDEEMVLNGPK